MNSVKEEKGKQVLTTIELYSGDMLSIHAVGKKQNFKAEVAIKTKKGSNFSEGSTNAYCLRYVVVYFKSIYFNFIV